MPRITREYFQTPTSQPLNETRRASASGGGTSLTTSAARIVLPDGTDAFVLMTRNYSTAVVVGWAPCPYILVLKTADDLATVTDYSDEAQDGNAATDVDLSSLGLLADGDYVIVAADVPFRGLDVDVDAANANASVLLAEYWDGTAWVSLSATDGTANAGKTFAQDGSITWTVPTAWAKKSLQETHPTVGAAVPFRSRPVYAVRLSVSAALDASTTLNSIIALPRSTSYAELPANAVQEVTMPKTLGGHAAIEALTDAGTANLIVNAQTWGDRSFS